MLPNIAQLMHPERFQAPPPPPIKIKLNKEGVPKTKFENAIDQALEEEFSKTVQIMDSFVYQQNKLDGTDALDQSQNYDFVDRYLQVGKIPSASPSPTHNIRGALQTEIKTMEKAVPRKKQSSKLVSHMENALQKQLGR